MNFMSPKMKLGAIAMILGLCVVAEAKVITVTNSNDHLAGTAAAGQGLCLRDAVSQAQPGDVINFNLKGGGTIKLLSTITLTGSTIFNGNGVTVQADTPGVSEYSLFEVNFNNPDTGKVVFNDIILRGGSQSAMLITAGTTDLNRCVVRDTKCSNSGGGLLVNTDATLNMTDCTVTNNSAAGWGGGIFNGGILNVTGCTISNNTSPFDGSGICTDAECNITNSTIANNWPSCGVTIMEGTCTINASTICYNTNTNGTEYHAGGMVVDGGGGLTLYNSIVAGNNSHNDHDIYNNGTISGWNNAVGPSVNYTPQPGDWITTGYITDSFTYANDNQTTGYLYLDSELKNNGGPTQTLALTNSSTIAKSINPYFPVVFEAASSDGAANDSFGCSVAVSADGNTVIVGASDKTVNENERQGKVYVFTRSKSSWIEQASGSPSDGAKNDNFGCSVAVSADGNTAIVGADGKNLSQGAAYVFVRNGSTWTPQGGALVASDGMSGDSFGGNVAISADGNTALIGAFNRASGQGAVYVFIRSGDSWSEVQTLTALDGAVNDSFGSSIAVSTDGNTAIIGAPLKTISNHDGQGVAYVFVCNDSTWSQYGNALTASDGAANDFFGSSVAISANGDIAVIGASNKTVKNNSAQGVAYIFASTAGVWKQHSNFITSSNGAANDSFGWSAAMSSNGNTVIIGAPFKTIGGNIQQGTACTFVNNNGTWIQKDSLAALDGAEQNYFGCEVAISADGTAAVIGASNKTVNSNPHEGVAYMYYGSTDTGTLPDSDQREYLRNTSSGLKCIGAFEYGARP